MFIQPHKYTNINLSVIGVASDIISVLSTGKENSYSEIQNLIISKKGQSIRDSFYLATCLLFALGKIEYQKQADLIFLK